MSIDSPHSPLDIEMYVVKSVSAEELISLTQHILSPFSEGNPLIFVPQKDTNSIFIVSTPFLIERALTVMEDLDIPAKETVVGRPSLGKRSVFVYKVQNRTLADINEELMNILQQMKERGAQQPALEYAIEGVQEAEDTNSLVFLADDATIAQLKDLLSSLDTTTSAKMTYYIYKIQMAPEPQISASLQQMKQRLQASKHPDMDLIKVIDTMEWNEETNSLIFIGSPNSINKLKEILPTFDVTSIKGGPKSTFLIYNPQYRNGEELYNNLEDTGRNLKDAGLVDSSFLQTLATMKWTPSTNSLLFTGTPQSLDRIQGLSLLWIPPLPSPLKRQKYLSISLNLPLLNRLKVVCNLLLLP